MRDFTLPFPYPTAKIAAVLPISKMRGGIGTTNHETSTIITGCYRSFNLPMQSSTGRYIKLFDKKVQTELEKDLGLDENTLRFTAATVDGCKYWNKASVAMNKEGKKFDLSDAVDYINWAIMYVQPNVAKTFAEIKNRVGEYDFFFFDDEERSRTQNVGIKEEALAQAKAIALIESKTKMIKFLKVHTNKAPDKSWGFDKLENVILNIAKNQSKLFLKTIDDVDYEVKLLVAEAVQTKALILEGKGYRLGWSDVRDYVATSKNEMVEYLKNPANNKVRIQIDTKVKEALGELMTKDEIA